MVGAVDIGGTKIAVGIVNPEGNPLNHDVATRSEAKSCGFRAFLGFRIGNVNRAVEPAILISFDLGGKCPLVSDGLPDALSGHRDLDRARSCTF